MLTSPAVIGGLGYLLLKFSIQRYMKYLIVLCVFLTSCLQNKVYVCTQYIGNDSSSITFKGTPYEYNQFIQENNVYSLKTICK